MIKVTVIMPSLNVAKYIDACMKSVMEQTLQDIEILAIDAGSTDGTLDILEKYAKQDDRIKVIHSDKKSYGYQVNLGIAMATGEYVGVVETDDLIMPEMLERLYREAVNTGADYVKGAAQLFMELSPDLCWIGPITHVFGENSMYGKVLSPQKMPDLFLKDYYLWTGIYRQDFIKQIVLNETPGAAYQDAGFMFQTYMKAERAVYLLNPCYLYRQDNMNASAYDRRAFDYFVEEYNYMENFLHGTAEKWREIYYQRMLNHCLRRFLVMGASGEFWEDAVPAIEELQSRLRFAGQQGILNEQNMDSDRWEKLMLFLESPRVIYETYAAQYKPKVDNILSMLKKLADRDAIIFGSGKCGRFMHALIEHKRPGTVKGFCDNQKELWETAVQGIQIMSPDEAKRRYPNAIFLIAGKKYETEMREQMRELGVYEEQIFTYTAGQNVQLFHV